MCSSSLCPQHQGRAARGQAQQMCSAEAVEQQCWCCTALSQGSASAAFSLCWCCSIPGIPTAGLRVCAQQGSWICTPCEIPALVAVLCHGPCYLMYLGQAIPSSVAHKRELKVLPFPSTHPCSIASSFQGDSWGHSSPWSSSFPNKDSLKLLPAHLSSTPEPKAEATEQGLSPSMASWPAGLHCTALTPQEMLGGTDSPQHCSQEGFANLHFMDTARRDRQPPLGHCELGDAHCGQLESPAGLSLSVGAVGGWMQQLTLINMLLLSPARAASSGGAKNRAVSSL